MMPIPLSASGRLMSRRTQLRNALLTRMTWPAVFAIPAYFGRLEDWVVEYLCDNSPDGRLVASEFANIPRSSLAKVPLYSASLISYASVFEVGETVWDVTKRRLPKGIAYAIGRKVGSFVTSTVMKLAAKRGITLVASASAAVIPYIGWVAGGVLRVVDVYLTYEAIKELFAMRFTVADALVDMVVPYAETWER